MFEVNALLGMKEILANSPTIVVLLEWRYLDNPQREEEKAKQLLAWLFEKGFRWWHYAGASEACELGTIK